MGYGLTIRKNAEPVLLCPRGKSLRRDAGVLETIIAPVREHTRKPVELYERIEAYVGEGTIPRAVRAGIPSFLDAGATRKN
jgi:N6-adenosine-specific RNA methylase IME4